MLKKFCDICQTGFSCLDGPDSGSPRNLQRHLLRASDTQMQRSHHHHPHRIITSSTLSLEGLRSLRKGKKIQHLLSPTATLPHWFLPKGKSSALAVLEALPGEQGAALQSLHDLTQAQHRKGAGLSSGLESRSYITLHRQPQKH